MSGVLRAQIKVKSVKVSPAWVVAAVLRRKSGERELPWFGIGTTTTYIVHYTFLYELLYFSINGGIVSITYILYIINYCSRFFHNSGRPTVERLGFSTSLR